MDIQGMPVPGAPGAAPQPQAKPETQGPGQEPGGADFKDKLSSGQPEQATGAPNEVNQVAQKPDVQDPSKVNEAQKTAMAELLADPVQGRQALSREAATLVQQYKAGKVDPQELTWKLFDLQMKAQDLSLKSELVSKVIEHGTSGVKTVLQTQA